jgi:uncharacterized repeat protein (TIGR02543 family)
MSVLGLGDLLTSVRSADFSGCTGISSLTLGAGINTIEANAFGNCRGLLEISAKSPFPPSAVASVFTNVPKNRCMLYITLGSRNLYRIHPPWEDFLHANIVEKDFLASDAKLRNMTVFPGRLEPVFQMYQKNYTVHVPNTVSSIAIAATPSDPAATVTGTGNHPLSAGVNSIYAVVTAADGETTRTYTVSVTRQAAGVNYFTVTFDTRGGSATPQQTVEEGGKLSQPSNPTRADHGFGGWFREEACITAWNFATDVVTGNITLYAKWTEDGVTGSSEIFAPDLKIYPTPFTDAVRITGVGTAVGAVGANNHSPLQTPLQIQLRITNAAGVIVHIQPITAEDETIRLEHLPAGMYFFTFEQEKSGASGKQSKTVKIVKN